MDEEILKLIDHFGFSRIPLEGTLYARTYTSSVRNADGRSSGTAIIGMYCEDPKSASTFHKVDADEMWHFYRGNPFCLHLLHEDGRYEKIVMGPDLLKGQKVQFTVPAGVWQAGELMPGSRYALFGCTVTPGFIPQGFEAGLAEELITRFPQATDIIRRLAPSTGDTRMPEDYKGY